MPDQTFKSPCETEGHPCSGPVQIRDEVLEDPVLRSRFAVHPLHAPGVRGSVDDPVTRAFINDPIDVVVAYLAKHWGAVMAKDVDRHCLQSQSLGGAERESHRIFANFGGIVIEAAAAAGAEVVRSIEAPEAERAIPDDGQPCIELVAGQKFLNE